MRSCQGKNNISKRPFGKLRRRFGKVFPPQEKLTKGSLLGEEKKISVPLEKRPPQPFNHRLLGEPPPKKMRVCTPGVIGEGGKLRSP